MQYWIKDLPNEGQAKRFKVHDEKNDHEVLFRFPYAMLTIWGNPVKEKLGHLMIAYIKKNGWGKQPVEFAAKNTPGNLGAYIAALTQEKAAKKEKAVK